MCIKTYLLLFVSCLANCEVPNQIIATKWETECKKEEPISTHVHIGWPFKISCIDLLDTVFGYEIYDLEGEIGKCQILDSQTKDVVFNTSFTYDPFSIDHSSDPIYVIPKVTTGTPDVYVTILSITDSCWYQNFSLNKTEYMEKVCAELPAEDRTDNKQSRGQYAQINCWLPGTLYPKLHIDGVENVTYDWTYNCTKDFPPNTRIERDTVIIDEVTFEDAGLYQCSVLFNEQRRHVIETALCVRYEKSTNVDLSISCPEKLTTNIGESTMLECFINMGEGKAPSLQVSSHWNKEDSNVTCEVPGEGMTFQSEESKRHSCGIKSNLEDECFLYDPEMDTPKEIMTLTLNISNVQRTDFGKYNVTFLYNQKQASAQVELVENLVRVRKVDIVAISVSICFLLLVVVLVLIGIWKRKDVMWYWKKHFGPYEEDDYQYLAYFSYFYDNDAGKMSDKSKKLTENFIMNLHEFMVHIGGKTFDDQKDINPHQYQTNALLQVLKSCHRVIIVLSPEYVKDQWSSHVTYEALRRTIEEGKKPIFVIMPDAKKEIKNLKDAQRIALNRALKMNKKITWSGKVPFSGEFKRRLEYSLPKLPNRGYNRYLSTSSQAPLTGYKQPISAISMPSIDESDIRDFDSKIV